MKHHDVIDHQYLVRALHDETCETLPVNARTGYRSSRGALRRAEVWQRKTVTVREINIGRPSGAAPLRAVETSFSAALVQALSFDMSQDARYLPGWWEPTGMP